MNKSDLGVRVSSVCVGGWAGLWRYYIFELNYNWSSFW